MVNVLIAHLQAVSQLVSVAFFTHSLERRDSIHADSGPVQSGCEIAVAWDSGTVASPAAIYLKAAISS